MPRRSPSMVQTPKAFHSINVFSSNSRFCMSKQIAPKFKKSGDEKINLGSHCGKVHRYLTNLLAKTKSLKNNRLQAQRPKGWAYISGFQLLVLYRFSYAGIE